MRIDIQFLLSFEHTDNSGPLRDRTNVRSWLKNSRWFIARGPGGTSSLDLVEYGPCTGVFLMNFKDSAHDLLISDVIEIQKCAK